MCILFIFSKVVNVIQTKMPPKRSAPAKVSTAATKRKRTEAAAASTNNNSADDQSELQARFIELLSQPEHKKGITNSTLKAHFSSDYSNLVPIINELTRSSKLTMSKMNTGGTAEVSFSLITEEEATKLEGLDAPSKMVYRVIESSGDKGIWTVDVRAQTNIPQGTLTKIFKARLRRKCMSSLCCFESRAYPYTFLCFSN